MTDDKNPKYMFSLTDTELLCAIVNGEIDSVLLAKQTLADRGLNNKGKWIGFESAKIYFDIK